MIMNTTVQEKNLKERKKLLDGQKIISCVFVSVLKKDVAIKSIFLAGLGYSASLC
jgi:hypothetical protein